MRITALAVGVMVMISACNPDVEIKSDRMGTQPNDGKKLVTLAQIHNGVVGRLGQKLGTIVTIRGQVVKNRSRAKAHSDVPFWLEVQSVNGRRLAQPVLFRFPSLRADKPKTPQIGDRFAYLAYEGGGFTGTPDGLFDHLDGEFYATTSFHFETYLRVLKQTR